VGLVAFSSLSLENFHRSIVGEGSGECPSPVVLVNRAERRWMRLACRRRRCPYCGPRHWKPYVQAGMLAGIDGVPEMEILLVTLTAPGIAKSWEWNLEASTRWNAFITYMRRAFPGARIAFWKIGERQGRGCVHYHIVLRGLRWLPVEVLRTLALRAGFGYWVWVGRPERKRGGIKGLLGYYGKYMLKGSRLWWLKQHIVTHSHDWRTGWRQHGRAGLVRADGSLVSPWSYCGSELQAYVLLNREAVRGSDASAGDCAMGLVTTLTAGRPP